MSYGSLREEFMKDVGNKRLEVETSKTQAKQLNPKDEAAEIKALQLGVKVSSHVYAIKKLFRLG